MCPYRRQRVKLDPVLIGWCAAGACSHREELEGKLLGVSNSVKVPDFVKVLERRGWDKEGRWRGCWGKDDGGLRTSGGLGTKEKDR